MIFNEEKWNAEAAAEIVTTGRDVATGAVDAVVILNEVDVEAQILDRNLALAVADRIRELALELPEPPRALVRRADTDRHLRALDA